MNDPREIRAAILDFLRRELIGPDPRPEHEGRNQGEEILRPQDPPRLRYSAGVLFPGGASVADSETATREEADAAETGPPEGDEPEDITPSAGSSDDQAAEPEVNRANDFLPSAMGLSALVRLPRALRVVVRAGRYERRKEVGLGKQDKLGNWQDHHWRRPVLPAPIEFDCAWMKSTKHVTKEFPIETGSSDSRLALHVYCRPYVGAAEQDRDRIVTFTLINRTPMAGSSPRDSECFFQCGFTISTPDGLSSFLEYPVARLLTNDEEERSLRLLYRHRRTFAVGHGCAAAWPDTELSEIDRIETDSLPSYEIRPVLPREIPDLDLSMITLAKAATDPATALKTCERLAESYLEWIDLQTERTYASDFAAEHRQPADRHLDACRQCHKRVVDGILLLRSDPVARQAFAWMNRAMLMQQLHYGLASDKRRTWKMHGGALTLTEPYAAPDLETPPRGKGRWRPFQLAFILMNLRGLVDPSSPERAIVDVIWFPTGGGKTEAYLGLSAFTLFHRRLVGPQNAGTTVLMRYTLRLLTTQQFQRAASLICACEAIRREHEDRLGPRRISIGLWVGQGVTPNRLADATRAFNHLLREGTPNPFVVLTCPWCGAEMGGIAQRNSYVAKGYRKESGSVVFRCEDRDCSFSDPRGLPLLVVDEAIYDEQPSLVIGTVDKFAMLPWYPEARRLFGLGTGDRLSPPALIIQDELHLISGALGSMVGLYESSIDALCMAGSLGARAGAKIVASTATICQADQQVRALYARETFLFPPQGLRAADSFFAEELAADREGKPLPGRLYVGVFGSALSSHVTAQVRVMSALLQAVKCVPGAAAESLDPYWTLMAYFNSLRELGHAATLIRADIREHLNATWDRLAIRKPEEGSGLPDLRRFINRDLELTSRIQSDAITDVLQQLFNSYPAVEDRRPVDVCLATNMIQVGLDVPRLGLMTVVGQPKTTSEYIQATSRVGRDSRGPGLVVTVFNPGKPRDRSHFEHFRSYHQSIYRWVEPTSVTPFAIPVRERALHAQLITLLRYWGETPLRERPTPTPPESLYETVRDTILSRIQDVDPGERDAAAEMLAQLIQRWRLVQPPIYGHFGPPPQETPLMHPAGTEPRTVWSGRSKATPSSMRNVDSGCDAGVIRQYPQG